MKTIFLFIPNYVYATDLIRTGFLSELALDSRVIVYLPTLEYIDQYPVSPNIEYKEWNLGSKRFWSYMKLLRVGMIRKFDDLLSIRVHYRVGFKDWRRRLLRGIALCIPYKFSTDPFTWLETHVIKRDSRLENDMAKYKPSLAAFCTPGFTDFESEAIALCRKYGLPTVALNFSWDNLTTNAKHLRRTDHLIVWNEFMKAEAVRYHDYNPDDIFVSGAMRFDYYFTKKVKRTKEEFLEVKGLDPVLPLLAVTTTSHGVYPFHRELVRSILGARQKRLIPECNVLIRVHPKDNPSRYEEFRHEKNLAIDTAGKERKLVGDSRHKIEMEEEDLDNLHATLRHADVVINYTSTITLEALACDTPVINIAFPKSEFHRHYEYIHYKPIMDSGATDIAHSEAELLMYINIALKNSRTIDKKIVDKFFFMTDGLSYKRASGQVRQLLKKI